MKLARQLMLMAAVGLVSFVGPEGYCTVRRNIGRHYDYWYGHWLRFRNVAYVARESPDDEPFANAAGAGGPTAEACLSFRHRDCGRRFAITG